MLISAIAGMGGIGKTELALRYAYKHLELKTYPGGICWIGAQDNKDIGLQIIKFAQICEYPSLPSNLELVEKVRRCWQKWGDAATLIIFDNVPNHEHIEPFLPPSTPQFRVLLTSRTKILSGAKTHQIEGLCRDFALELLGSFDREIESRIEADSTTADRICQWLGDLPLGLELVGRYLAKKLDLSLLQVWAELQAQSLKAKAILAAYPEMRVNSGVIAAFELSWQELNSDAQELAARLSLFALAEIPWDLVEMCVPEWETEKLICARDEALLNSSLLIRTGQEFYELHQLLREFFALKLQDMPRQIELTTQFAQLLAQIAKIPPETITLEWQVKLGRLIPHFVTDGLNNIAVTYKLTGRHTEVEPLYLKSLAIREEIFGEHHLDTATILNNLASLYKSMGKYPEANSLYLRALGIIEPILGTEHLITQRIRDDIQSPIQNG